MNPIETKTRYIRIAPFAIAIFCFALPFIQISCSGRVVASLTGIQLATGAKIQPDNAFAGAFSDQEKEQQKVGSEPTIVLTLICAAAGLALCFLPGRPGKLLPAIAGAAGFACLLVAKSRFDTDIIKQGQGMLTVDYVTGFILTCLSLLAGSGLSALQLKQSGALQSAGQPLPSRSPAGFGVPPPPPPPSPLPGEGVGAWTPPVPPPSPPPTGAGAWAPPAAPAVVMAPAPQPRAPRQPISRNTKLALAGALGVAALSAIAYWTYNYLNRAPSKTQVSQALEEQLKKRGQHLVDVSTKLISSSGGNSQGLDLVGQWSGTSSDGTSINYTFRPDGSVTWMVNDFSFRASYPSGLQARYSLHNAGSLWQIDIKDFQDPTFSSITVQGILQSISAGQFKMDARPSNQAARPETFGSEAVIFTRNGAGSAGGSPQVAIGSSGKSAFLEFTAVTELTEPYYVPITADQYLQQQGADPLVFRKIRGLLMGTGANRIRELAGISGQVEDLQGKTLLKVATPKGHQCTYTGKIQAVRNGKEWQLSILPGVVASKDAPVGNALSLYRGDVYATDQPDQVQKISNIISTATNDLQKLEQAQLQYRAEVIAAHALAANPASAIAKTWFECEGTHCGQWVWNESAQDFEGVWSGGAKATIKIKQLNGNKVVLTRVDQTGVSAGLTATYEGTIDGDKIEGTVTWFWQIFEGGQAHGTWKATIQK